jgi:hypothetical protein
VRKSRREGRRQKGDLVMAVTHQVDIRPHTFAPRTCIFADSLPRTRLAAAGVDASCDRRGGSRDVSRTFARSGHLRTQG